MTEFGVNSLLSSELMAWVFVISFILHCNEKQYKQRNANNIRFTPKEIMQYDQVTINL